MTTETPVRNRTEAVIEFEAAIARFSRAVLHGDSEFVVAMTELVDNMTGSAS